MNSLHKNLKFTREKANKKGELAFSDMIFVLNQQKEITYKGYRKSTDTEDILTVHSFVPLQHKKNIVERTSNWKVPLDEPVTGKFSKKR